MRAADLHDWARGRELAKDIAQRARDLAKGATHARRLNAEVEEILIASHSLSTTIRGRSGGRRGAKVVERRRGSVRIALRLDALQHAELALAHRRVVDRKHIDGARLLIVTLARRRRFVLVDTDHDIVSRVDARLLPCRALLNAKLGHAALDCGAHTAECLHFVDHLKRGISKVRRESLFDAEGGDESTRRETGTGTVRCERS